MESLVSFSIRQFTGAWTILCDAVPGSANKQQPGLHLLFTGLPIPFFNAAFLTGDVEHPEQLLLHARATRDFAAPFGVPYLLVSTKEATSAGVDLNEVAASAGFVPIMTLTGMLASDVAPLDGVPDGLTLGVPADDDGCMPMLTINEAAYGMEMTAATDFLSSHAFWKNHVAVVGRNNGAAVSCSAVLNVDDHRYVAFVATHPDHQRKGYAGATMRHSLSLAAQSMGPLPTALHATDAGRPVYERMGYQAISTHTLFMESKFLEH